MTTTRPDMRQRQFVLGPERVRVTILTTGAETGGRHDFTDSWLPAGTPAHLLTPDTQPDLDLFMAVTTELGDVVLGPPGTLPADLDDAKSAWPQGPASPEGAQP
ncbi:MAG: hypothetical protein K0S88_2387 [Actinomycetia bacterium]|nr:hypothetical protein [Actinomycetes bacterium]